MSILSGRSAIADFKRTLWLMAALFLPMIATGSWPAKAQSCPAGSVPLGGGDAGWHGCSPVAPDEPDQAEEVWEVRWGAIAVGDGAMGAVEGAHDKQQAEEIAVQRCNASQPGARCWVRISYYNQCAALAWGDGGNTAFRGPDINEDGEMAVKSCSRHTTNCKVFYSACSPPERVR